MSGLKLKLAGGLLLAGVVLGWVISPAQAANLDKEMLKEAGAILDKLKDEGINTVGVLPFRVKKGARPAGFNAAPLATGLPGRIENALIVSQGSNEKKAVRIIRDAVGTASRQKVGSWLTGRGSFARLFTIDYDLAWGTSRVKPDGFITGEVVNPTTDRARTTVNIDLITPRSWKGGKVVPVRLHSFKVDTDRSMLSDLGYAFALPRSMIRKKAFTSRALDQQAIQQVDLEEQGQKQKDQPGQTAAQKKVLQQQMSHTPDNLAGFKVEVEYDGVPQEIRPRTAAQQKQPDYRVDGAKPGQKVVIYLTRIADGDQKLGVVLKVNGKSTFQEEELDGIACKKWLYGLDRKGVRDEFKGFYFRGQGDKLTVREFKVLTPTESADKASELGSRAGWIDITVFASSGGQQPPKDGGLKDGLKDGQKDGQKDNQVKNAPQNDKVEVLISTRGATRARAGTLKEVQDKIAKANNLKRTRLPFASRNGLILMSSEPLEADPYKTDELPSPTRIGHLSIQYYEKAIGGGDKTID